MTSNRNALAYAAPSHVPASVPAHEVDAYLDAYPSADDFGHALPIGETDAEVLGRRTRADHDAQDRESAAEHAALTAELDALPVASYVVVTALDGLPVDGGADVGGDLQQARQALHDAAMEADEHTETAQGAVDVLAAATLARSAGVGTVLALPGGVTLTLALRRA